MAHVEFRWVNDFRRLPDSPCEDLILSFVFGFWFVWRIQWVDNFGPIHELSSRPQSDVDSLGVGRWHPQQDTYR